MTAVGRGRLVLDGLRGDLTHIEIVSDSPLGTTDQRRSLTQLRGHVDALDGWLAAVDGIEVDEPVDLKVREVQIDVDRVRRTKKSTGGCRSDRGRACQPGWRDDAPVETSKAEGSGRKEDGSADMKGSGEARRSRHDSE